MTEQDLQTIIQAIKNKQGISFEYNKPGKVEGIRIGNPYVIYANKGETKKYLDLHQTNGVSDSATKYPIWRTFETEHISNVTLMTNIFTLVKDYQKYNPKFLIADARILNTPS